MPWVVDTCLLFDIGLHDPQFGTKSVQLLESKLADGLVVCPVTFVELAPSFGGLIHPLEEFLRDIGVNYREDWTWEDTKQANTAWSAYTQKRRARSLPKRPVADVLIGAFASRFQGLLTRNSADFATVHPGLQIVEP